jgi:hypothetical protein
MATTNKIYTSGVIPGAGSGYTINIGTGANGTSATDMWTNTTWTTAPVTITQKATIDLKGEDADVVINGKSLRFTLEKLEERLAMLEPNHELEKEWSELKRLGDAYRQLEKDIQEKTKTWDILKK